MVRGNQSVPPIQNQGSNASSSKINVEDSSSPFYLSNADNPGLNLVPHLLTGANYNTWSRAMTMALTAKNKLGFVDHTIRQPPSDDLLFGSWLRCNSMVLSWILNSITKDISDSLMYIPTACEVWEDLRDRFHQSNAPRIFQIKKLLSSLHQGSMDVSTYYTRLRILWDELKDFQPLSVCHCGSMKEWVNYQNQECVMQFLMGLNDSYSQIRAQILMMDPIPIISKIFSIVVQEERQRSIHQDISKMPHDLNVLSHSSSNAVASVKTSKYMKSDQEGGGKEMTGKTSKFFCSHCEWPGHTADRCYKLHGYPPGHPKYKQQQQQRKRSVAVAHGSLQSTTGESMFNPEQVKHLISLLNSQLPHDYGSSQVSQQHEPFVSCLHGEDEVYESSYMGSVHVKDVALAHILVYENTSATGRHLCIEAVSHFSDFAAKVAECYPEYKVPRLSKDTQPGLLRCKDAAKKLIDLGIQFIPMEQIIKDSVESLRSKGYLP